MLFLVSLFLFLQNYRDHYSRQDDDRRRNADNKSCIRLSLCNEDGRGTVGAADGRFLLGSNFFLGSFGFSRGFRLPLRRQTGGSRRGIRAVRCPDVEILLFPVNVGQGDGMLARQALGLTVIF